MSRKTMPNWKKKHMVLIAVLTLGISSVPANAAGKDPAALQAAGTGTITAEYPTGDTENYRTIEIPNQTAEEWKRAEAWPYASGDTDDRVSDFLEYGSDYGYQDMQKRSHGEGRQYLYQELKEGCDQFTGSTQDAAGKELWDEIYYTAFTVDVSGYGLTNDEMVESYYTFRNDNPQYFWLSNEVIYSDTTVTVLTYDRYSDGDVRRGALDEILNTVQEVYQSRIEASDSRYEKVLTLHDTLIADISYSEDTSADIAHSIAGALTGERSAVCEGYAKVMQLMMNCYDIPNIYVTGYAGGGHAWNMVYMNDGNWYWLDATWDDQPYEQFRHDYFLVGNHNFADHTADSPEGTGTDFLYELPEASAENYVYDPGAVVITAGDVNEDGSINVVDLMMCLHHVSGRTLLEENSFLAADVNGDGMVNVVDLMRLLHYVSGRNSEL